MWPKKPFIYQINTVVWLNTLSRQAKTPITLDKVPSEALDELTRLHIDAVWLMGVWYRSYECRASALKYLDQYRAALPDIQPADVAGSAYAIGMYQVDERIGGRNGLAAFRRQLAQRGIRLILDFVPNHVATDHAWVTHYPERLIHGQKADLKTRKDDFFAAVDALGTPQVIAHGRDPHFAGWADTAQINAFHPAARHAASETLLDIAHQCDGVRCDMAMLFVNDIFAHTWKGYIGATPATEYWAEVIPTLKSRFPEFLFIGEVYWDMEARMHNLGFDYCYDKRLYDRARDGNIQGVREHLNAKWPYQSKLVRFIENHDEPRAAAAFGVQRSRAAAVLVSTLPGATLLHDGQFSGRTVKLPVQISRQPDEKPDLALQAFYDCLLAETRSPIYQSHDWHMLPIGAAKANGTEWNLLAYGWRSGGDYRLIVINLTGQPSQANIMLNHVWPELGERDWRLHDVLDDAVYVRTGAQLMQPGLYVDLPPYDAHIFQFS